MKRRKIFFAILFIIASSVLLSDTAFSKGKNERGIDVVQDDEKRSCIQTVDGYAYLSEDMTLKATRAAAFANAKRQALESAQTYISSKTKVEDFVAQYDMVWSEAEGAVTVLEQKDHGIVDNTRYHVWIKAEVIYSLKPKKKDVSQVHVMDKRAPLTVKVWTPKKHYKKGDSIQILIQGNRDFYARVVDITSTGDIIQLLPNDFRKTNFFKGGQLYSIPDKGDRFDLKVSPPYGEDKIIAYASEAPLGNVELEPVGQGLNRYAGDVDSFATMTRGISVNSLSSIDKAGTVSTGVPGIPIGAEFYEGIWTLTTGE